MINADKFEQVFGIYATELWAKPEKEFLEWLNSEAQEVKDISIPSAERTGKWINKQYTFGGCSAECSKCHERTSGYSIDTGWGFDHHFYEFCPRCGTRMVTV